ncbi:MAG TPA: hypothetical protein VGK81_09325, partial [Anaerolineae bacterium]
MSTSLQNFLDSQVAELQPLLTQINQLYWLVATTGMPEHEQQFAAVTRQLRERLADPARYKKLNDLLG